MRTTRYLLAAIVLAAATGCSSSSSPSTSGDGGTGPGTDGSTGHDTGTHDGAKDSPTGSETGPLPDGTTPPADGGDGGTCTFESYVTGLINTDTTASALPSTTLGAGCTDTHLVIPISSLHP